MEGAGRQRGGGKWCHFILIKNKIIKNKINCKKIPSGVYLAKHTWVAFFSAVIRKIPHRNNLKRSVWLRI